MLASNNAEQARRAAGAVRAARRRARGAGRRSASPRPRSRTPPSSRTRWPRRATRRARRGGAAIADDSGLCVDALGGAPGVASAHFARARRAVGRPRERSAARRTRQQRAAARAAARRRRPPRALRLHAGGGAPRRRSRAAGRRRPLARRDRSTRRAASGGFGYDPLLFIAGARHDRRRARRRERRTRISHRALAARADARADARGLAPRRVEPDAAHARPVPSRGAGAAAGASPTLARSCARHADLPALPPLSLYVHLPWCLKKCPYCDFNSHECAARRRAAAKRATSTRCAPTSKRRCRFVWGRRVHTHLHRRRHAEPVRAGGDRRLLADDPRPPAARAGLRDHAGSQSRHLRARALPRLSRGRRQRGCRSACRASTTRKLQALGRVHDAAQARAAVDEARRRASTPSTST